MSELGQIRWSNPGCVDPLHHHQTQSEKRGCLSHPMITIYDPQQKYISMMDNAEDMTFFTWAVLTALKQVSSQQQKRGGSA